MNIQSKSLKIATEIGKPERQPFIERQLVAKREHYAAIPEADLAQLYEINRAAIDRSLSYDRARLSAVSLSRDEQIALASYIIDHLDGVDDDARNAAVDAIGELL